VGPEAVSGMTFIAKAPSRILRMAVGGYRLFVACEDGVYELMPDNRFEPISLEYDHSANRDEP
jgi:hypothetical protein